MKHSALYKAFIAFAIVYAIAIFITIFVQLRYNLNIKSSGILQILTATFVTSFVFVNSLQTAATKSEKRKLSLGSLIISIIISCIALAVGSALGTVPSNIIKELMGIKFSIMAIALLLVLALYYVALRLFYGIFCKTAFGILNTRQS